LWEDGAAALSYGALERAPDHLGRDIAGRESDQK
jgi:hypothetical protein